MAAQQARLVNCHFFFAMHDAGWSQAGAFPALTALNLSNSQLTGSVPAFGLFTGAAPNLQELELSSNYFSGNVMLPSSHLISESAFSYDSENH